MMKKRYFAVLLALVALFCCLLLPGCGGNNIEKKLIGAYIADSDAFLRLSKEGVCYYGEDDETGTGQGTWYVEDGILYIYVDNLNYRVYASLDDFKDRLYLEADSGSWNAEYFTKIKE